MQLQNKTVTIFNLLKSHTNKLVMNFYIPDSIFLLAYTILIHWESKKNKQH